MPRKLPTLIGFGLVLGLYIVPAGAVSASPLFARDGKIYRINAHRQVIVVNDVRYLLPVSVRVFLYDSRARASHGHEKGRELGNGSVLRRGMHIGFNVQGEGPGRVGRIVEAWILPPNSLQASSE